MQPTEAAIHEAVGRAEPSDSRLRKMLYGVEEATEVTGLGRSKLYELMAAGDLESVKCGKRRLIPRESLESFVDRLRGIAAAS